MKHFFITSSASPPRFPEKRKERSESNTIRKTAINGYFIWISTALQVYVRYLSSVWACVYIARWTSNISLLQWTNIYFVFRHVDVMLAGRYIANDTPAPTEERWFVHYRYASVISIVSCKLYPDIACSLISFLINADRYGHTRVAE